MKFLPLLLPFIFISATASAGLDITAYENLQIIKSAKLDKDGEPIGENMVILRPADNIERFAGLQSGEVYKYKSTFEFRAGSYSGYNEWRNELAKLAGYKQTPYSFLGKTELRYDATVWNLKKGPFWELIVFSDSEGVIGPESCNRTYVDFVKYHEAAKNHPDINFRELYEDWFKAFTLCAKNGAIVFH